MSQELNIRDLAQAYPGLQERMVYRSSCLLAKGSKDTAAKAVSDLDISVLLDLRSEDEMKEDVSSDFSTVTFSRTSPPALPEGVGQGKVRYIIPLLERENLYRGVLERVSATEKAAMLWYSLVNYRKEQEIFIREINRGGLAGLNKLMIDQCCPEIGFALKVVTAAAEGGAVVGFQCRLGKDRTGLLAALILAACGAPDKDIVTDYVRSDGIDEIALGSLTARQEQAKQRTPEGALRLQRTRFVGAEAETMTSTLQHLRERHGGAASYLGSIGFTSAWQHRLRTALISPTTATDQA